jgi:RNA polymerase sigma-70 factor (sigma-E family)
MTMQHPRFDDEFGDLAVLAYRVAFRILGDRATAEDIAQEALARAYQHWSRISAYRQAWIARVAGNLAIDQIRRRRPQLQAAQQSDAEVILIERLDLQRALLGLPKRQRDAVVLRYIADLSEADVATLLGCSPGTVKSHLNRGTSRLRLILNDPQGGL